MNDPYRLGAGDDPTLARDLEALRLAGLLYYVAGGVPALMSCAAGFFWIVIAFPRAHATDALSSAGIFWIGVLALFATMAGVLAHAGRCLQRRRRLRWCQAVAALSTLGFPFGTALGVFTLILLGRPNVRALFANEAKDAVAPSEAPRPALGLISVGWVSARARTRFVRHAVVIGVGLVLLHLIVPAVSVASMVSSMSSRSRVVEDAESAQTYAGRLWLIEDVSSGGTHQKRLASVAPDDDEPPLVGPDVPSDSRYLAADGPRLWILGEATLSFYEAGRVSTLPSPVVPYWPSRLFDYNGEPAFFDWSQERDEIHMVRLEHGEWQTVPLNSWNVSDSFRVPATWSILPAESGFDVFMQFGDDLRWRHVAISDDLANPQTWELVSSNDTWWATTRQGAESVVVLPAHPHLFDHALSLLHRTDTTWVAMDSIPVAAWGSFAATTPRPDSMDLVLSLPEGLETLAYSGGKIRTRHEHTRASFAPVDSRASRWSMLFATFAFVPSLVAAAFLSRFMRRDRIDVMAGEHRLQFASLLQRGLAYGIDSGPVWIATLPEAWRLLNTPPDAMAHAAIWSSILLNAAGWAGTVLVMSYMEGRWGVTVGKWLVGIRVVGTDAASFGFRRALLRNAFRIVDGTLSFGVGMFAVAFSRDWQRLGDAVARTVVVRRSSTRLGV